MSTIIYYFSGTGNSLYVAKDIAAATGGTLVPAASLTDSRVVSIDLETDIVGLVFPVYYGELPVIIKEFAGKLENLQGKYIFAVCTFGGSAGDSHKILGSIISARGGNLAATYGIHMPQNAFYKFWEKHEPLYRNWRKKVKVVAANTAARKRGSFFTNPVFDIIFKAIQAWVRPRYKQSFIKLSGATPDLSVDELIRLNDTSCSVTAACTGCGLCAQVCPVNNIEMVEDRPVWLHRCENCLACYNSCPVKAIENGIAHKNYYYRHPDITTKEIMAQKGWTRS
jgi:ferredoxin/flavodoxin